VDLLAEGRVDGGTRWNCEHRHNLVEVMPMWRAQVDETWELLHLQGIRGAVAFARGAESGGASRRHGWVMINRNETLIDVQIETGPSHRSTWHARMVSAPLRCCCEMTRRLCAACVQASLAARTLSLAAW
jgi:hypothetical protein